MGKIVAAWAAGMAMIGWGAVKDHHEPPPPSDLLVGSGFFVVCALVALLDENLGALLAWGVDIAGALQIAGGNNSAIPSFVPGTTTSSSSSKKG